MLLISIPFAAFSLKKTDFSGEWSLDKAQSKLNTEYSFAPVKITITQEKNSMTSERVSNFGSDYSQEVLTTDSQVTDRLQ